MTGLSAVAATGTWGNAVEVPGTATLNKGNNARINAVSCASAGNCGAGGSYTDSSFAVQPFVVNQTSGTWGNAEEVPGIAALSKKAFAEITDISCASAGNCSAGGDYTVGGSLGHPVNQIFVVNETNGTWGNAEQVPGTQALVGPASGAITGISCPSAGNCSASGYYPNSSGDQQAIVVNETSGTWGKAIDVPGTVTLNQGGQAFTNSVSCVSSGICTAGGFYTKANGAQVPFVVTEKNGTWGTAQQIPGMTKLNVSPLAGVTSISCVSVGNCAAGGNYSDSSAHSQSFVASETNGTWGNALEVPGSGALNKGEDGQVSSVSCRSAGNCSAGGIYFPGFAMLSAYVVNETNGTWGTAVQVPGLATLNTGETAEILSLSCGAVGNCSAAGYYESGSPGLGPQEAFVVSESGGTWGKAQEVPGTATLNKGKFAATTSVSCASANNCSAGGWYSVSPSNSQAFVVRQT